MARIQLTDFRQVVEVMRELGVASWANSPVGDIVLGQAPPPKPARAEKDPHRDRRIHYTELLGRPVTDGELEKLP